MISKKSDTCKIQLTIAIKVISSKNDDEQYVMYSNGDNNDNADEVIEERFELLLNRYQI